MALTIAQLGEVTRLKEEIDTELKLCRSAWVYMSLKCRSVNASGHAQDVKAYFNAYYKPGFAMIKDANNNSSLRKQFSDRINELHAQLKEVYSILSDANAA
jgi:plasmid maintenance system killer protein